MAGILRDELISILDNKQLTPFFQPIVSLKQKRIIGYEALVQGPPESSLSSSLSLFNEAERLDLGEKLEYICSELIVKKYAELSLGDKLFIKITPSVLLDYGFKNKEEILALLERYQIKPTSLVIVLKALHSIGDYQLLKDAILYYRNIGFQLAIDDLGCFSDLRLWAELLPNYVKIDNHFIQGIDKDVVKYNFVRAIQNIASCLNCFLIVDGIESEAELRTTHKLGINYVQGYYFSKPAANPLKKIDADLFVNEQSDNIFYNYSDVKTAIDIAKFIPPISSLTPVNEIMALFQRDADLNVLPLVDNHQAVGIVFKEQFLSRLFSNRFGLELYGKKPIIHFFNLQPIVIEHSTPLQKVSQQITEIATKWPAFVVTYNGDYAGVATVLDLLAEITTQQVHYAQYANPLTLLPGSVPINEHVNRLLKEGKSFSFAYFDLDNFKPFNDVYGYSSGDEIIKVVASILTSYIPPENGLVGHIGGDDFIVVFTVSDWLECCQKILSYFATLVPSYYSDKDREAGGIYTENRSGELCFFPLICLSAGLVDEKMTSQCQSHVELADLAAEAKKQAKKIQGNSFFINRRQPPNKTL